MGASDWFRLHGLIYKKLAEAQSRLVEPCGIGASRLRVLGFTISATGGNSNR